jgi:hypothetical protein
MRVIAGLLLYGVAVCAQAALITIDFEEYTEDNEAVNPPSGDSTSKGYTLDYLDQGAGNPVIFTGGSSLNGTRTYANCPDCQSPEIIDIYETLGGTLKLESIDIGTAAGGTHEFRFIGTKSGGGTINYTVNSLEGVMSTVTFDEAWFDLDSFRIEISPNGAVGFSPSFIDNIAINTVPIPAAVWLFGSALAGLGWLRRTR